MSVMQLYFPRLAEKAYETKKAAANQHDKITILTLTERERERERERKTHFANPNVVVLVKEPKLDDEDEALNPPKAAHAEE